MAYLGPGSAGHYVKMVHNGIEYAIMELIAETYDLMKRGFGLSDDEMHTVYAQWNQQELNSFLLEITANIFEKVDPTTGRRLIDVILDVARQKGTGMWTSQDAMELHVPVPSIDTAVEMRDLSVFENERKTANAELAGPTARYHQDRHASIPQLANALYMGMIIAFAQGFTQLRAASTAYQYDIHLDDVARIWRGGCIIRAELLQRILQIYQQQPALANLLLDAGL
ncbi:MAG TPA: NADP-dependent phosphogluconate dehydrogenase, partial [Armatimonadota bacterium]|nr:NADP-dependent phosphogluconate dehydrogenase [Armatimonadota bacterium]